MRRSNRSTIRHKYGNIAGGGKASTTYVHTKTFRFANLPFLFRLNIAISSGTARDKTTKLINSENFPFMHHSECVFKTFEKFDLIYLL